MTNSLLKKIVPSLIAILAVVLMFYSGILAVHAITPVLPIEPFAPKADIRFGVMSDTHIGASALASLTPETRLQTAYQTFAKIDPTMDAIVTVGDFTEGGTLAQFNTYKSIMDANSPAKENILSMGNHDNYQVDGQAGKDRFEEVFGYPATTDKVIGGYHFITLSPLDRVYNTTTHAQHREWLEGRLALAHAEDPSKPIFIFIHQTIIDTCIGSRQAQADPANDLRETFSKYPQVITFSGHSHVSTIDPRNIWQGDYTALNCGSVYYAALDYTQPLTAGQTNNTNIGYSPTNRGESSTALVVDVEGTVVTVHRIDMYYGLEVAAPFVFDTSVAKADFPYRLEKRTAESSAPEFAPGTDIVISNLTNTGCTYTFAQAVNTSTSIPDDGPFAYTVSISNFDTGAVVDTARLQANYFMVAQPQTISYNTTRLSANTSYKITITPISFFGKEGAPISTAILRNEAPTLEIADVVAAPGGVVDVTYSIKGNVLGFTTLDLELPYNGNIYQPSLITPASVLGNGTTGVFAANPSFDGKDIIKISYSSSAKVTGDGLVFTVTYKVAADAPLVDEELTAKILQAKTDLSLTNFADINLQVKPGALVIGILGDIDGNGKVTPEDAMLLLQMYVGLVPWTPRALLLGDVNGDGQIDPVDAALILRMVVGG
ncbi:MAG: metallophosphoesterase [Clostridiales bacterium]|jgi:hypothetical protein|nr:metallophosphoesterase [Clostridiales bacterium]